MKQCEQHEQERFPSFVISIASMLILTPIIVRLTYGDAFSVGAIAKLTLTLSIITFLLAAACAPRTPPKESFAGSVFGYGCFLGPLIFWLLLPASDHAVNNGSMHYSQAALLVSILHAIALLFMEKYLRAEYRVHTSTQRDTSL